MSSAGTSQAVSHISVVTVNVTDQNAALRFYTACLGFEKRTGAPMG
jgi:catechol 2,3-dioxygenase-like lactoylglutathione lyase family enzyme